MIKGQYVKYVSFIHHKIRFKLLPFGFRPIYAKEFSLNEANILVSFYSAIKIKQNTMPILYFTKTYIRRYNFLHKNETIEIIDKQYNEKYIYNEKFLPSITSHLFSS